MDEQYEDPQADAPSEYVALVHGYNPHNEQRRPAGSIQITGWFDDETAKYLDGETYPQWEKRQAAKFSNEAKEIYSVLSNNLPGGTLHALLIEMLLGKTCLYTVVDLPDTTIKDIALAAREAVWESENWEQYIDSKDSNSVAWPPEWLLLCQLVEKRFGPPPVES